MSSRSSPLSMVCRRPGSSESTSTRLWVLFFLACSCLWEYCRLFGRERDKFPFATFLLFSQIGDDGLQVIVKFPGVRIAHFAYFLDNWIVPHITPPSICPHWDTLTMIPGRRLKHCLFDHVRIIRH